MKSTDRESNRRASHLSTTVEHRDDDSGGPSPSEEELAHRADAEAVSKTLAGDLSAFDGLIEQYQRRAVAVAYRLLGNIDDALDVCQDAFLKAYRALASLQSPERFGAWLLRIVANLSLNYRRGRRTTFSLATDSRDREEGEWGADLPDRAAQSAPDLLAEGEVHQAITEAIESLPEQQRLALVLFAIEGMPQREVAEILQCSVEMVKWNVFQARKKLKDKLDRYIVE